MADDTNHNLEQRELQMLADLDDPMTLVERVYDLWAKWGDFHIHIISPHQKAEPPKIISAELIPGTQEYEFVYPIISYNDTFSTSKAQDMFSAGRSMCKLYYTIEKMIAILVEHLKANHVASDQEVQIAFRGHELAQRKAFESVINLSYNIVVTNFDPGVWGENYLKIAKNIADKGFGYPNEAPRDNYKQPHGSSGPQIRG